MTMTREKVLSAALGAIMGVLTTGLVSMLTVGDRLHHLEVSMRSEVAEVREEVAALRATVNIMRQEGQRE